MATPDIKPYNTYFGNGSTTEFSVSFPYTKQEYVKLYLKRIGATEVIVDPKDYDFISKDTIRFPSLSSQERVLGNGEIITIQRETVAESEFDFSNQKRLFPEDVMDADDLEMQILQEHARHLERSIAVSPTSQVNPEEFLGHVESIYSSVDNINKVANDLQNIDSVALNGANINTVAGNIGSVRSVASNISNINAVNANKDNINSVNDNKANINTVANNIDSVATVALSNSAINSVAGSLGIIKSVDDNKTNIVNVYMNESNINKVASNKTNIDKVANNQTNINIVSTNIDSVNNCSTNMSAIKDAPNQANRAKQYADQAQAVTEGTLNETQITNCITEIPQDIKLELVDGTLTLKAGSKVYVPNGAGKFDEVVISTDYVLNNAQLNGTTAWVLALTGGGTALFPRELSKCVSGAGATTSGGFAYDTTTNIISWYNASGVKQSGNCSLPVCIFSTTNGVPTSIDQVFNGFGYIGSTVFALPGVKGLIPNGRNADGSLKNTECVFSRVVTSTNTVQYSGDIAITSDYFDLSQGAVYNEKDNKNYQQDGVTYYGRCLAGKFVKGANGVITLFQPKTTFHAVDYNGAVLNYGNQDIGGDKTFTGNLSVKNSFSDATVYMKNTNDDITQIIATEQTRAFRSIDKNGKIIGDVRFQSNGAGQRKTSLIAKNAVSGTEVTGTLSVYVNNDGSVGTSAQTPSSATDNSTKIATTAWCYKAGSQGFLMGVPNYAATLTVSNTGTYTAPSNGYLFITVRGGGAETSLTINGVEVAFGWNTNTGVGYRASIPMSKGDIITWDSDRIIGTTIFVSAK